MQLEELLEFVKVTKPKLAMDIRESLLLLNETITEGASEVEKDVEQLFKEKNFKGIHELTDRVEEINNLQELIEEYINQL